MDFLSLVAIPIGKAVGSYFMGKGGDYVLEQASFKRKIKRIIKLDKKYIRRKFSSIYYKEYPIEKFLLEEIFQDQDFLYPFNTFPSQKSDDLYERFRKYISGKGMDFDPINEDEDFRPMLEDCVDYHNTLVHQVILDPSQRLLEKDLKEHITATGYAGHTLDSTADILSDNSGFEYAHRQVDSILQTLRMDLRFYRLVLVMCTIGLMIISPIIVALYANYSSIQIAMIAAALCSVTALSIFTFEIMAVRKVIYCEKAIKKYTELLWEVNSSSYTHMMQATCVFEENTRGYRDYLSQLRRQLWEREDELDAKEKELCEREKQLHEQLEQEE